MTTDRNTEVTEPCQMYGQLTAIAREFNFPSSTGVCLYFCYTEQGITMTPRLSDDIWQTIWGIADTPSTNERRPPIAGKLEFDLDLAQARWYPAWVSSRRRSDSSEHPMYQSPTVTAIRQFGGDNRFAFPRTSSEDGSVTDRQAPPQPTQRSAPVITRHVPKKLSLVERYDAPQSAEAKPLRSSGSPPTGLPSSLGVSARVLSPITQQEEPKSARLNLSDRVKSWRASTSITPLVDAAPEITPPTQTPEDVSVPELVKSPNSESSFHIEDYAFSISSAGPDDSSEIGSYHQEYLPSVHLADRANGSVCSTASYCTSFGPSDYTIDYDQMRDESRIPSPDIAYCMFEDRPSTPMTATSWGPASVGSIAYFSEVERSPSLDIAFRMAFSRPTTPGTATSWGAASYDGPWSPFSQHSGYSINMANRGDFSTPPTPQTATSWGPGSPALDVPESPFRLPSPDAGHRGFENGDEWDALRESMLDAWRIAMEAERAGESDVEVEEKSDVVSPARPWGHGWPYRNGVAACLEVEEKLEVTSPAARPWGHSWPYKNGVAVASSVETPPVEQHLVGHSKQSSQPTRSEAALVSSRAETSIHQEHRPWGHSWPYRNGSVSTTGATVKPSSTTITLSTPPAPRKRAQAVLAQPTVLSAPAGVYPNLDLYPAVTTSTSEFEKLMV